MKISAAIVTILTCLCFCMSSVTLGDSCSCSYNGTRSCSASITCSGSEKANFSCTSKGCSSSCSASGTNQQLSLDTYFSELFYIQSSIGGAGEHFKSMPGGGDWMFTVVGTPPTPTITETYVAVTFEEVLPQIADDFGMCVEISEEEKLVTFRPVGTCY